MSFGRPSQRINGRYGASTRAGFRRQGRKTPCTPEHRCGCRCFKCNWIAWMHCAVHRKGCHKECP